MRNGHGLPSEIHDFPGDFLGDFILTHVSAKGCFRGNLSRDFHQFLAEWSQVVQIRDGERMWTQHKKPQGTLDGALLIVWLFFAKIVSTQSLEYPLKRSSPFLNILLTAHWSCKNRETDALMLCYSYSSNTYPQEGAPKKNRYSAFHQWLPKRTCHSAPIFLRWKGDPEQDTHLRLCNGAGMGQIVELEDLFPPRGYLVGGLEHGFYFPYIWNNHPNWLSYFSEGLKPPTS